MRDLEARSAKTADVRRDAWPIRHALHRLLAQDSWERPYVDAARESLDALIAKYVELAEAVPIVTDGRFDAASAVELAADWRDEEAQA